MSSRQALTAALRVVARRRKATGNVRDITVEAFLAEAPARLRTIRDSLRKGRYLFSALRPVAIEKKTAGEYRPILVPSVPDRVVQRAILHAIADYVGPYVSHKNSHAFREGSGVRSAVRQLRDELRGGKSHVLVVDIVNFFPSVDTSRLFADLTKILPDDSLNPLLNQLRSWEISGLASLPWTKRKCFPESGSGLPQGSALSPLLSNFYLRDLDAEGARNGVCTIRYADDIAVPCNSRCEAEAAYTWISQSLSALGLQVPPLGSRKSYICELGMNQGQGIEYLGFYLSRFTDRRISIRPSSSSYSHAVNTIKEIFDPAKLDSLAERYTQLTFFLNGWLNTFGYVCGVERERDRLLTITHRIVSQLLVTRGLLHGELSAEQRRFLGVDTLFARAEMRKAIRRAIRDGRPT